MSTAESVPAEKVVAPEAAASESTPAASSPIAAAKTETTLSKFFTELPTIFKDTEHQEMWGIELSTDESHIPTHNVLRKFLRANSNDFAKAKAQFLEALSWRKKMEPLKLLAETEFDSSKFGGLGYVTTYEKSDGKGKEVVTWNIYGAVKDNKTTFGNVEDFVKWRCALMELSIRELDLASGTERIPETGLDPYQMVQVHDYLEVSFLRMDPAVKAASKETIQVFSMAYPELLKEKFFVNVPLLMSWVFAAMKVFMSPQTVKKFHPLGYGSNLAGEIPEFGTQLPEAYGGKGGDVKTTGKTVQYAGADSATKA